MTPEDVLAAARADSAAFQQHIEELTRDRAWPWLQPGYGPYAVADGEGNVVWVRPEQE